VIAINGFLEEFYRRFQNPYFAQVYRCDRQRRREQLPLPLRDPPFWIPVTTSSAASAASACS